MTTTPSKQGDQALHPAPAEFEAPSPLQHIEARSGRKRSKETPDRTNEVVTQDHTHGNEIFGSPGEVHPKQDFIYIPCR